MFMERLAGCSWNRWPDAVEYAIDEQASDLDLTDVALDLGRGPHSGDHLGRGEQVLELRQDRGLDVARRYGGNRCRVVAGLDGGSGNVVAIDPTASFSVGR